MAIKSLPFLAAILLGITCGGIHGMQLALTYHSVEWVEHWIDFVTIPLWTLVWFGAFIGIGKLVRRFRGSGQ